MTRLSLLLALAVAGCDRPSDQDLIERCHAFGYAAVARPYGGVQCRSVLNGDDIFIEAAEVTKHRRETGQ